VQVSTKAEAGVVASPTKVQGNNMRVKVPPTTTSSSAVEAATPRKLVAAALMMRTLTYVLRTVMKKQKWPTWLPW
jgi:carbohydrate-binding DOMON domain-containing protein